MNVIWRFFVDAEQKWRWQTMSADRSVLSESRTSYASYDRCVSAARASGYVEQVSQPRVAWQSTRRARPPQAER